METAPVNFRVGVVGSRRRNTLKDRRIVYRLVDWLIECAEKRQSRLILVSGGCRDSADEYMEEAARINRVETLIFPIDRNNVKDRGDFTERAYARNREIAVHSNVLFCLVHSDRTGGTENTISHGLELSVPIFLVDGTGSIYLSGDGTYPKCEPVRRLLD